MLEDYIFSLKDASASLVVLATLVLVFVLGTAAQIIADRIRLPATGPLLIAGLLFGPAVLGVVQPSVLGPGLRVIVSAAVAVVVFEGGLLLDVTELRHTSRAVLGLVTVGLLITTSLAALLAHILLGWPWELAFLFGAIISVTGPTVITPILQKVRVNRRVRSTLESESVIADPLGVILAAVIFTAIISPGGWRDIVMQAFVTFTYGAGIGTAVAVMVWVIDGRLRLMPVKYARLVILSSALLAYTVAELLAHESGVLAAAVAGIVIGSLDIPYKEQVEEFKGDIASMAVSAVFILLAASLHPGDIAALGWSGLAIVVLVMVFVRPIRVFLSTWGSELRTNEKAFVALLGPRGIVAASVAAFFSLELVTAGYADGRNLEAMVFAVILATVLIEGTLAGWTARIFKVMPQHTIIVGADETGRLLAERLAAAGETVSLIDLNEETCALAANIRGVSTYCADATDPGVLKSAGADNAKCLIAATSSDKLNLLVCTLARSIFDIPRLVGRANSTSALTAFEAAGIETVSPPRAAATILENMVLRPSLFKLLSTDGSENVAEVRVCAPESVDRSLAELALQGCVVVALRRDEKLIAPKGSTRLREDDVLTLLGQEEALQKAIRRLGEGM